MKKTMLLTLEYPPTIGGVSEYLSGLFGALPQDKVSILTADKLGFWKKGTPLRWLPSVLQTWRAVKKQGIKQLVISHLLPMGYTALLLKVFLRLPYVVIVHGMDLEIAALNLRKKFLARLVLMNAGSIITNSEYTRNILKNKYKISSKRSHVIYPCPSKASLKIPTKVEVDAIRDKYGLKGKKVLLSVGRLVKRKGFDRVISLFPKLKKFCGDAVYIIVGSGPEESRLRSMASGEKDIIFTGVVEPEDISKFYEAADAFITIAREQPGDVEGFGIVYLEAGVHSLPVIAESSAGGVQESVVNGETGILVDGSSEDEVIGAIRSLMSSEGVSRRMGSLAKKRVESTFTWKKQAEKLMELL